LLRTLLPWKYPAPRIFCQLADERSGGVINHWRRTAHHGAHHGVAVVLQRGQYVPVSQDGEPVCLGQGLLRAWVIEMMETRIFQTLHQCKEMAFSSGDVAVGSSK
jgi:hypothetical protein